MCLTFLVPCCDVCLRIVVSNTSWGRHVHDRMVVGFTTNRAVPITTNVVHSNLVRGEVYTIQQYVIKFVSDLRQLVGFLHQ
jgi:hypothetical protein